MHSFLLAFSLLLATASHGDASPAQTSALDFLTRLDYLIHLAASTCTKGGQIICSEQCDAVIMCVSDGQGGFNQVDLEQCSADTRCSAEKEACVEGTTSCNAGASSASIDCHGTGYFPDPYDCTRYHLCLDPNGQSTPYECEAGHAYNSLYDDCSFDTSDAVCTDRPVPACTRKGQNGPVPANPSIYYVCVLEDGVTLIPELYRCDYGMIYDPAVPGCTDTSDTSSTSSTTSTTTSTTTTPPDDDPSDLPTPGTDCWPPGKTVADPGDCRHYFECSEHLVWLDAACSFGFYFNPVHGRCELGWC